MVPKIILLTATSDNPDDAIIAVTMWGIYPGMACTSDVNRIAERVRLPIDKGLISITTKRYNGMTVNIKDSDSILESYIDHLYRPKRVDIPLPEWVVKDLLDRINEFINDGLARTEPKKALGDKGKEIIGKRKAAAMKRYNEYIAALQKK